MTSSSIEHTARSTLSIGEASVVTGVTVKAIHRLIDDKLLPSSTYRVVDKRRVLLTEAAPMVLFGATDGAKLSKGLRTSVMGTIRRFTRGKPWVRYALTRPIDLVHEDGMIHIDLSGTVRRVAEQLSKLEEADRLVVRDPDIRGGMPTIRGTRVGVYEAAAVVRSDGVDAALEAFPSLNRETLEAAVLHAKAHPRIGRPAKAAPSGRRLRSTARVAMSDLV